MLPHAITIFVGSRACTANHYVIAEKRAFLYYFRAIVGIANRHRLPDRYHFRKMSQRTRNC